MKTKRKWFFNQRFKYLLIIGATLLPIVSILLIVFLMTAQPVFTSLEDIAIMGSQQMHPLSELEIALLKTDGALGKYLISGGEVERENWEAVKKEVEKAFDNLMGEDQLSSQLPLFQTLKEQWRMALAKEETLRQTHQTDMPLQNVVDLMWQFDTSIDQIIQQLGRLADIIGNDIQARYSNIQKLKTQGIILSCIAILLGLLVGIGGSLWLTRDRKKMVDQSLQDPLTGAFNRRGIDQNLLKMQKHQFTYNPPCFSILMIDLDKFKQVNDQYGHDVGDMVLKHFSAVTRRAIRSDDVFGRFGGEEFLVLLPGMEMEDAVITAERIRRENEASTFTLPNEGGDITVTVSIGCSTFSNSSDKVENVFKKADEAMYRAKEKGRNRVVCG